MQTPIHEKTGIPRLATHARPKAPPPAFSRRQAGHSASVATARAGTDVQGLRVPAGAVACAPRSHREVDGSGVPRRAHSLNFASASEFSFAQPFPCALHVCSPTCPVASAAASARLGWTSCARSDAYPSRCPLGRACALPPCCTVAPRRGDECGGTATARLRRVPQGGCTARCRPPAPITPLFSGVPWCARAAEPSLTPGAAPRCSFASLAV